MRSTISLSSQKKNPQKNITCAPTMRSTMSLTSHVDISVPSTVCVRVRVHVHVCMWVYVCVYACVFICVHACVCHQCLGTIHCVCVCVCMFVCVRVYVCTCRYLGTILSHTHSLSLPPSLARARALSVCMRACVRVSGRNLGVGN